MTYVKERINVGYRGAKVPISRAIWHPGGPGGPGGQLFTDWTPRTGEPEHVRRVREVRIAALYGGPRGAEMMGPKRCFASVGR